MLPSGIRIWKKPRPLTAMSSGCSVVCSVPVVKIFWVPATRTPVPSCRPEGSWLSWLLWPPGCWRIWYSRSSNSARSRLKPVVETFARLLEIVVRFMSWADRPVFATQSAGSICALLRRRFHGAYVVLLAELQDTCHCRRILLGVVHHLYLQFEL